jgi:hypothetical protein
MTGARSERRLSKRAVEGLLATYDDDPIAALEVALRHLCDRPAASFDQLVDELAQQRRMSEPRRRSLRERDVAALDALAAELNETRALPS